MGSQHTEGEGEHSGHHWCSACGIQMCAHCGWFGECIQCHLKEECIIRKVEPNGDT